MTIYINHANQTNIPAVLRQLAADIEAGWLDYGTSTRCAIVIEHRGIDVIYCGKGEAAPSAHLLMHKGMAKLAGSLP